ncbi:hypothetical protein [Desulfitobacterium dichloroeliminans]|uniref:hypothetical protein n=1 Tax=Desulfitobacterium dichloroeliminans TaxID=233055 RepID=UPI00059D1AE9|nr:hypothetical protein [Desulfitobacterium dichloroeliminans]
MFKLELPTYKEWATIGWNTPNTAESPIRKPKDIDLQEGTTSKRAATRSSRKACSGVGLETGRFQLTREPNKCEKLARFSGWRF